jgi:hypothetical protein
MPIGNIGPIVDGKPIKEGNIQTPSEIVLMDEVE